MAGAAQAQDIVVTGRGLEQPEQTRALGGVTLDREALAASGDLETALGEVAGLQQFRRSDSRSSNPTSQGITLRGLGGNAASRALLILDGVPQADPFGGWVAFPAYSVARLGAVRVTRGGGSGLWGAGALAGTVELTSAVPGELDRLSALLRYGSRDSLDAQGSAALVRPGGFATLHAGYARGDGFVPIVESDRGAVDVPARYRNASVAVRGVVSVAPATELQATIQAFTDRRTRGYAFSDNASEGADASLRAVHRGRWRWSALGYVQTRGFASRFASIDAARAGVTPTLDQYSVPAVGYGSRVEIEPPLGDAVTLRIGGDLRALEGTTNELYTYVAGQPTRRREAGGRSFTGGGYADLSVRLGEVVVEGGARIERWRISGGRLIERPLVPGAALTDLAFPTRTGTEPTGRIGLSWQAAPAVRLRASGYRGWRLPTLNELYRPFRVGADATAAEPGLTPERLWGGEAGFDLGGGGARLSVTAFGSRVENAIANVGVATGPGTFPGVGFVSAAGIYRRRVNLGAVEARGIEIDGSVRLGAWQARLSYAYAHARIAGPLLTGLRPAQTPAHQLSATLGWTPFEGATASLGARYASVQFEDDTNTRVLSGAFTLDARGELPVTDALAVELRAENLTDAFVAAGFSGIARERATPRTLWVGARMRLR